MTPAWILTTTAQRSWTEAAIGYYKAKVEIYKLMVEEWETELAVLRKSEESNQKTDE